MSNSNHDSTATKEMKAEHIRGTDNEDIFDVLDDLTCGNKEKRNMAEEQCVLLLNKCPDAAKKRNHYKETPLHLIFNKCMEIKAETQLVLVPLLLEKYEDAAKEKDVYKQTPLHVACLYNAPVEVISYLLEKYAAAAMEIDIIGCTPLHLACCDGAYDAIPLLLRSCPDAAKVKDVDGFLPLHKACRMNYHDILTDVVSSLLDCWPDAIMEKTYESDTPLHMACDNDVIDLKVVTTLLEKWPEAVFEKNDDGKTPVESLFGDDEYKVIKYVSQLCGEKVNTTYSKEMIDFFMQEHINWRGGVALVFKKLPAIAQTLDLDTNVVPEFLHFVGSQCDLCTMYEVVRNKQDLFSDV